MDINEDRIRLKAYQLWERRGRPFGTENSDWFEARRLLLAARDQASTPSEDPSQDGVRYGLRRLDTQ